MTQPTADRGPFVRAASIQPPPPTSHAYDEAAEPAPPATHPALTFHTSAASINLDDYPVVPDSLTKALGLRTTLAETQARLWDGIQAPSELPKVLLNGLTAGDDMATVLDHVLDAHRAREHAETASRYLALATEQSERHLRRAIEAALPELMDGLRAHLEHVVNTLRAAYADAGELDIHQPDPMLVAEATERQRAALVTIAKSTKSYRKIRRLQRDALVASTMRIPGNHRHRDKWSWRDVFATGVHEVSSPGRYGLPGDGSPARLAVRAVVTRSDVWLPSPDDLTDAYDRMVSAIESEDREAARAAAAQRSEAAAATPVSPGLNRGTVAYLDAVSNNNGRR